MDEMVLRSSSNSDDKQDHYHSVLARMVSAVSQDHAQLRSLIYEFARRKLRKDLFRQFEDGDWSEIERQVSTLEAAIDQVEAGFSHDVPRLSFSAEQAATNEDGHDGSSAVALPLQPISQKELIVGNYSGHSSPSFLRPARYEFEPEPPIVNVTEYAARTRPERHLQFYFLRTVELVVAVTLGVAIYSAIDGRNALRVVNSVRSGQAANTTTTKLANSMPSAASEAGESQVEAKPFSRPGVSGIPLPSAYGVYALSDGKLTSLDLFPLKIPDPRIAISATISTPSQAHVPAGPLEFVVYRRDLANDAPDRVSIRVVAQIMRALTFDPAGKAAYTKVEPTWVVRSNSYQMNVAPAADSPEMIVIRPDQADFALPAGRYALVLKKEAYDFTLDGPVRDAAHCLERTDALGGAVYSECRKP